MEGRKRSGKKAVKPSFERLPGVFTVSCLGPSRALSGVSSWSSHSSVERGVDVQFSPTTKIKSEKVPLWLPTSIKTIMPRNAVLASLGTTRDLRALDRGWERNLKGGFEYFRSLLGHCRCKGDEPEKSDCCFSQKIPTLQVCRILANGLAS